MLITVAKPPRAPSSAAPSGAGAERDEPAAFVSWCSDPDENALEQMHNSMRLPSAVRGALMPDAHLGYGLPIGGVLATEGTVIPYAVGVDIACRMKLTVYDRKANIIPGQRDRLANLLENETRFGIGCTFKDRRDHDVMDDDWTVSPVTRRLRDKAWTQLGTSGSGNHFVEFGSFKDIHSVMAAQSDLVEVLGRFDPKLVKMCPPGERAED